MPRGGERGKKSLSSRKRRRVETVDVDTEENYEGESTHSDCDEDRDIEELCFGSETPVIVPPDATPIPAFDLNKYPSWRTHFFKDWRCNAQGKVFARCTKDCKASQGNSYFTGDKGSFTNFKSHLTHRHKEEFESFGVKMKGRQPVIRSYTVPSNMSAVRQQQLDIGLAKMFGEDNLPLNLLRRKGFRNWIKVFFFRNLILYKILMEVYY
jgi:hypothetical protein